MDITPENCWHQVAHADCKYDTPTEEMGGSLYFICSLLGHYFFHKGITLYALFCIRFFVKDLINPKMFLKPRWTSLELILTVGHLLIFNKIF